MKIKLGISTVVIGFIISIFMVATQPLQIGLSCALTAILLAVLHFDYLLNAMGSLVYKSGVVISQLAESSDEVTVAKVPRELASKIAKGEELVESDFPEDMPKQLKQKLIDIHNMNRAKSHNG